MAKIELDKTRLKSFYKLMIPISITLFGVFFVGWFNYKNIWLLICAIIWFSLFVLFVILFLIKKKPKPIDWIGEALNIIKARRPRFKRPPFYLEFPIANRRYLHPIAFLYVMHPSYLGLGRHGKQWLKSIHNKDYKQVINTMVEAKYVIEPNKKD